MPRNDWLVKQEPEAYSWDTFVKAGEAAWTGVRNFQARNNLRSMKKGDLVFFYHSVSEKQVVGLARVLGAREIFTDRKTPPAFILELSGSPLIEIYPADSAGGEMGNNKLAGWRHLALRVDSIESVRDELARRGVVFEEPIKPAGGGGRVLFFKDGEGNLLHLVERSADSLLSSRNL